MLSTLISVEFCSTLLAKNSYTRAAPIHEPTSAASDSRLERNPLYMPANRPKANTSNTRMSIMFTLKSLRYFSLSLPDFS